MASGVGALEVGYGELRIMPDRFEGLVSEELLDVVEVGVGADELRGAAPPEGVRCDVDIWRGAGEMPADQVAERVAPEPGARPVEEEGVGGSGSHLFFYIIDLQ